MRVRPRSSSIVPRFSSSRSTWLTVGQAGPAELGDHLLRQRHRHRSFLSVPVQLGKFEQAAAHALVDRQVERLEQPFGQHANLVDQERPQNPVRAGMRGANRSKSAR